MKRKELDRILNQKERILIKGLNTPAKIQDWLESIPFNLEKNGPTIYSPRLVISKNKAHCIEGAIFGALALAYHGYKPLLLDLKVDNIKHDFDHVVAVFKQNGHWGAISKTRHSVLRYRNPVYKNIRELVMSYFHEYFIETGKKTLRAYSTKPFDLSKLDYEWVTNKENLFKIAELLDEEPHTKILTPVMARGLRNASKIEIEAGQITE